jgi:hypothetical protein
VVAQFTAGTRLTEFERILKLDEELLRYLIVLSEGEPTSGMSILAEAPLFERDDEDDDDDDDETRTTRTTSTPRRGLPPEFSGGRGKRRGWTAPASSS